MTKNSSSSSVPIPSISIFSVCQDYLSHGATDLLLEVEKFYNGTAVEYELSIRAVKDGASGDSEVVCPRPCNLFE